MSNKALRNMFIFGSLFFFAIFVALTVDTMKQVDERSPEITEEVNQGKMMWHKYDCIGCHTILGNGSYFAPDLTKVVVDKPEGYLRKFLENPRKVNPRAAMPDLGITAAEAASIVTFLEWISKVDTNGWPPEPVLKAMLRSRTEGLETFRKHGCQACHMVGGIGGTSGPALDGTASRHDKAWQITHLKDPASVVPDSAMPPYGHLDGDDIEALAGYLDTLR